ncbi:TAXI family TRAP transporter solute-binding subunit [Thiocapsa sp.]|uniref:TAXI family TRAP transporter solute-binding subunit n=1 Tax=Thiocapsa sp. TaxID=2024551 RepID=UPI0035944782
MTPFKRLPLLAAAAALSFSATVSSGPTFINILTGGTSGVYYPIGVALSQIYGDGIDGSKATVQATKASVENLNLLQAGRGELALALGDSVSDAWNGVEDAGFKQPLDKLRAIGGAHSNYIQIVAGADSGIRSLDDLKGKRISVGAPKSGTELNARAIFKAAGLTYEDMGKVEYLPYAESVELMKNRQLDATLQSSGLGMAAFRDLASTMSVRFIPVPPEVVAAIGSPAYRPGVIPANTYEGQDEDVPTAAIANLFVSHSGVSDELAYQMTKLMFDNLDRVSAAHSAGKGIKLDEAAKNLPLPLHPGAERFYREAGVLESGSGG